MRFSPAYLFTFLLFSCSTARHAPSSVEAAMQHYNRLILHSDADSIALLYTPDGELGEMARGRDSISKFLSRFKSFHVLSQQSTTGSISIDHDSALQKGFYYQTTVIPENDTVRVKGAFTAKWLWMKAQGWHISRMDTRSAN